jgi:hypothetical protein
VADDLVGVDFRRRQPRRQRHVEVAALDLEALIGFRPLCGLLAARSGHTHK